MSNFDDLYAQVPIAQIAAQLGVDEAEAADAVKAVLPALVGGLDHNAGSSTGLESLTQALAGKDTSVLDGGVDLSSIDLGDGAKILQHVFGGQSQTDDVAAALGASNANVGSDLAKKLLPLLAPIVLAWLAKQMGSKSGGTTQSAGGGSIITDILGKVLQGAAGGSTQKPSSQGPNITDILGTILKGR